MGSLCKQAVGFEPPWLHLAMVATCAASYVSNIDASIRTTSKVWAGAAAAAVLVLSACSDDGSPPTGTSGSRSSAASSGDDLILDVEFGDGRRIHLTCFGPEEEGAPTLLLESGGGSPSDTWDLVVDAMSPTRRICSYDRAGVGASPTAPEPRRTTKHLVADLEATLDGAGIEGPFVLVGWSFGVSPLTAFTEAHREDVVGVVLVDPRPPAVSERFLDVLPAPRPGEPESVKVWRDDDLGEFEHDPSLNPEHLHLARCNAEVNALLDPPGPFFGDLPLVLLSASGTPAAAFGGLPPRLREEFERIHEDEQRALAAESTSGSYEVVTPSGHEIQMEQPQAVVEAIESVLTAAAATSG